MNAGAVLAELKRRERAFAYCIDGDRHIVSRQVTRYPLPGQKFSIPALECADGAIPWCERMEVQHTITPLNSLGIGLVTFSAEMDADTAALFMLSFDTYRV